ncbi:MAG: hypothetical protein QXX20_04200 [Candidatus Thermoplasmatota archaeon]
MRYLLWPAFLFSSCSLLFFIPLYTSIDVLFGVFLILCSIILITLALRTTPPLFIPKKICLFSFVPLCVALLIIPFPVSIGVILLSGSFILFILGTLINQRNLLFRVATSIFLLGLIVTIQIGCTSVFTVIAAHIHRIDLLSPLITFLLNLFGTPSTTNSGIVYLQTMHAPYPFTTTLEKLGFYPFALYTLAAGILLLLFTGKKRFLSSFFIFIGVGFLYLLFRYATLILLYAHTTDLSLFWNPQITILSFIPFALLLMKILPLIGSHLNSNTFQTQHSIKKTTVTLLLVVLWSFLLILAVTYQDPGFKKQGRILIDEYHSRWEDSTQMLNTSWYGELSTYNYFSWIQYVSYYYDVSYNVNHTLTSELLSTVDILILKCPTQPYFDEEVIAVHDFVQNGGGVFLIGDHTNVFGMNTFLNQISEPLGIRFNNDALYHLETRRLTTYTPPSVLAHPIVRHIPTFEFMTSCSLEPTSLLSSITMENIMIGTQIISEPGTYATENFFRTSFGSTDSNYGCFVQGAALSYGKGRIVAFTDSTVFSSFCVFTDGYAPFSLSVFQYLNTVNTFGFIRSILVLLSIFFMGVSLWILRHDELLKIIFIFVLIALLVLSSTLPVITMYTTSLYTPPTSHTEIPWICFEQEYSNATIILQPTPSLYTDPNNYGTMYVWTQRLGYIPTVSFSLERSTQQYDTLVFINPNKPFSLETLQHIERFLNTGGTLLIFDGIRNQHSTTNDLINSYGMSLTVETNSLFVPPESLSNTTICNDSRVVVQPYLTIKGGEKLIASDNNSSFCSQIRITNAQTNSTGRIIVFTDSYCFSDAVMGSPFTMPTDHQRHVYATLYYLLEKIREEH